MKLKKEFVMTAMGKEFILVPTGKLAERFHGVVRLNETAAFIVNALGTETSREKIVDALLAEYEVERDVADRQVGAVLDQLRQIGALTE